MPNPVSKPKPLPQLRMRFTRFAALPEITVPEGYALRAYQPGDESDWATVLNNAGTLGQWDEARVYHLLHGDRHAIPAGSFFAVRQDQPVGAACAVVGPGRDMPEVGWVGVAPEHRGHGLAYCACLAVLHFLRGMEFSEAFLSTDDFRLPAIKTYLRLGFEPFLSDASHPGRWEKILRELGENNQWPISNEQ